MKTPNKLNKKAGRPFEATKLEINRCTRFSKKQDEIVLEKAAKAGLVVATFLRQAALGARIFQRLTKEDLYQIKCLIRVGNEILKSNKNLEPKEASLNTGTIDNFQNQIDKLFLNIKK